jgi:hypothetical protein
MVGVDKNAGRGGVFDVLGIEGFDDGLGGVGKEDRKRHFLSVKGFEVSWHEDILAFEKVKDRGVKTKHAFDQEGRVVLLTSVLTHSCSGPIVSCDDLNLA